MKNILLSDDYYIAINDYVYTLMKRTKKKDGGEAYKQAGYYSNLGGALMGYRRKTIMKRLSEQEGLKLDEVIAQVKAVDAEMRSMLIDRGLDSSGKLY